MSNASDPNITFSTTDRPAAGAEQPAAEASATPEVPTKRPYTIVFVSDLRTDGRLPNLTPVDKACFTEVLKSAAPKLALAVKPPLGDGPDWEFELTFDSLAAFEPAGLLRQVPSARARLAIWERIPECRLGQISEAELESAINVAASTDRTLAWLQSDDQPAGPGQPGGSGPGAGTPAPGGASILDLVDQPDEKRRIAADIERLAAEAPDPSKRISPAAASRFDRRRQRFHLELTSIADAVLKHPNVRRLECAWRSLKLLIDHIDFRAGVQLSILDAQRTTAVARFNECVIEPAFNGEVPTPGLILWDYPCQNTPVDIAQLDELARCAVGLPVPVAFSLEAAFFGVKTANLIKNLPNLSGLVDGWQFAKWRALREQPYSRCLTAVFGRFLLRPPHEARSADGSGSAPGPQSQSRTFTCTETLTGESALLWAGGHLAIGVCAARAHATHGWPTRMFGAEAGKLADLPVVQNPADTAKPWGPGDATLPDRRLDEFPAIGVNLLQSIPKADTCILLGGLTVAKPKVTQDIGKQQAALEVSVPYQQFSNIAGAWLCEQLPTLHGIGSEQINQRLLFGLRDLLRLNEEEAQKSIQVGSGPLPDDPTRMLVKVQVTPPGRIVPGGLQLDFNFAVGA